MNLTPKPYTLKRDGIKPSTLHLKPRDGPNPEPYTPIPFQGRNSALEREMTEPQTLHPTTSTIHPAPCTMHPTL